MVRALRHVTHIFLSMILIQLYLAMRISAAFRPFDPGDINDEALSSAEGRHP
jgi:hypothetical protein